MLERALFADVADKLDELVLSIARDDDLVVARPLYGVPEMSPRAMTNPQ